MVNYFYHNNVIINDLWEVSFMKTKIILVFHFNPFLFNIPLYYFVFDFDMNPVVESYDILIGEDR
jgi:hypothetical protein